MAHFFSISDQVSSSFFDSDYAPNKARIRFDDLTQYTSKYNPIEHRLFPHITRACSGVIFDSWKTVKSLMERAKTRKGLKVFATIIEGVYETGKKVAIEFRQNLPIIFDEYLPQWNYIVQPQSS